MIFISTDIEYDAPEGLEFLDDSHHYGRTEDGKFYARVNLGICSDACTCVNFDLCVQLSEPDCTALREGRAEFVTGRIEEKLPREFLGAEYIRFGPGEYKPFAAEASISLGQGDGLDPVFEVIAERERKMDAA